MTEKGSADIIQVNLRITKKLHKQLKQLAKRNKVSLNQEMLNRLHQSFDRAEADTTLATADLLVVALAGIGFLLGGVGVV